ncbi:uncharacterized protein [Halyomorpha halys]|uniref:uncharacterized protein n=1 Tax=Halyomorpha halys TaxID=286706 RepID=UPI0006D4EA6A|nr:uncharacterized protein LOC106679614 [Halyomorpha halys]
MEDVPAVYAQNLTQKAEQELDEDDPTYRLTRPKMRDYMVLVQVPLFILYPLLALFRFAGSCACSADEPYISWPAGLMTLAVTYYFQVVLREYWSWMQKKSILFGFLKTKEYWMLFRKPSEDLLGGISFIPKTISLTN